MDLFNFSNDDIKKVEKMKNQMFKQITNMCFTQMTATKGIKLHGQRAIAAMFKEYRQFDDLTVLGRLDPDSLSPEQKRKALRAINLIKEKRDGKLKGRTCADGSSQRGYVPREEALSPTLALESFLSLLLITAFEGRAISVFDIPGAYLHAIMPKENSQY